MQGRFGARISANHHLRFGALLLALFAVEVLRLVVGPDTQKRLKQINLNL